MFLPNLSIRRPVLTAVMSLMIVLLGMLSLGKLPVREYPDIDSPVVSVRTVYPGASSEIVESRVTRQLESALGGIEGVNILASESTEEVSNITLEFMQGRDVDVAAGDVRDRVARVAAQLPAEVTPPAVSKVEADARPILWLSLNSDKHDPLEVSDYARRILRDRLQTLPGVASVMIGGERRYAMRIWLDRDRLAAFHITVQEVEAALQSQNIELPSGRIEAPEREFTVLAKGELTTPEEFAAIVVSTRGGTPIYLRDVGRTELTAADERSAVRYMGRPAVGMGIVKQSTANTLAVAQAVKKLLPTLEQSLPPGMKLVIAFDTSVFIEESINAVYTTMAEALGLVVLVIFLFLRSPRATLVPMVAIPVSLIGAFSLLALAGFSVNVLTMLGLVLAIGLVVDDAIVVLENIQRRIEHGIPPMQAAFEGSSEIAFAVVAMTLTLAAVFAPLAFMEGNTGRLFTEFALTVAGAVLVSGFVALTLTPMLCSRLLVTGKGDTHAAATPKWQLRLNEMYRRMVGRVLDGRWWVLLLLLLVGGGIWQLYGKMPAELAPLEDRGILIGMLFAPEGASLEYTNRYATMVENIYASNPELLSYFVVVAPGLERPAPVNFAMSFVRLKPWNERKVSQMQVAGEIGKAFFAMPGVMAFPINPPSLGQSFRSKPIEFVIMAGSYDELAKLTEAFLAKASQNPLLQNLDSDLKLNKPQLRVDMDRAKLADAGIPLATVGRTLETLLGGRQITYFTRDGEQYEVIVQLKADERAEPRDLTQIMLRSNDGQMIPLSNFVTLREQPSAKALNHFNRLRAVTISASIAEGHTLGEALTAMNQIAREVLPPGAQSDLKGQSREFSESQSTLLFTFVLALLFIYLVLAAQFESFKDPFIIMLTVPLAILGALVSLKLTGGTLNVYSQIGMVMLIGLVTKNGILIVEFANQLRERGQALREALIEACVLRLRPILMTSLTMILGAVPLALAVGPGAESRQQIGWVVAGGLLTGTLLTLFVVPAIYSLVNWRQR